MVAGKAGSRRQGQDAVPTAAWQEVRRDRARQACWALE